MFSSGYPISSSLLSTKGWYGLTISKVERVSIKIRTSIKLGSHTYVPFIVLYLRAMLCKMIQIRDVSKSSHKVIEVYSELFIKLIKLLHLFFHSES